MDKASSVVAALDAGKLPTTEQLNAVLDLLAQVVVPAEGEHISDSGRTLANDVGDILVAYKTLNSSKNGDDLFQEAIWQFMHGDTQVVADLTGVDTDAASSDAKAARSSISTLFSLFWRSFAEGNFLLNDFMAFAIVSLADAAEVVEGQAGRAKDNLRRVDAEIQDGQRDNLGRNKERLEEEKDTRVAFEHRMDSLKRAGSKAIGAGQAGKETTRDVGERATAARQEAYRKACDRARNDPEYRSAFSTLFDIIHKWVSKAIDPNSAHAALRALVDDNSSEGVTALKTLLDRFSSADDSISVDAVLDKAQRFVSAARDNHGQVQAWVDEYFAHARRTLDDPQYGDSDEAMTMQQELQSRRRVFLSKDTEMGRAWADLKASALAFAHAVAADPDLRRVADAHIRLGKDAGQVFVQEGPTAVEQFTWLWRDLFTVYAHRVFAVLKDINIPRTEYVDEDVEFVMENLVSSFQVNPSHVHISNTTEVDVRTSETSDKTTQLGTSTHIRLQAVQLTLNDVSFYHHDKSSKAPPQTLSGLAEVKLPAQGIDIDLRIHFIPSADERKKRQAYHQIDHLAVTISGDVELRMRQTNHPVLLALAKPVRNKRFREALGRALSTGLRGALTWLDGIAWDVGRRAEVMRDTGMGNGPALAGAVWSEVGRLVKERKWAISATGTGLVVEDDGGRGAKMAMGAEPQVLSGKKHGPAATGSQRLDKSVEGGADVDADADTGAAKRQAQGLGKEVKGQVNDFQRAVHDKAARESQKPGWRSEAFNI
ncbi:hypothetical protein C8F01DRAFT_511228 [Mycena amicta]|nr:hypothetical protein C8F01DRAFT_511228 [Mycena amicta]